MNVCHRHSFRQKFHFFSNINCAFFPYDNTCRYTLFCKELRIMNRVLNSVTELLLQTILSLALSQEGEALMQRMRQASMKPRSRTSSGHVTIWNPREIRWTVCRYMTTTTLGIDSIITISPDTHFCIQTSTVWLEARISRKAE